MNPELGRFALCLALVLAGTQGTLPLWAAWRGEVRGMASARPLALVQAGLVALAFGVLVDALLRNDFTVSYVVANSNSQLPWVYRVCAAWGGHEGSVLLWGLMLALWGAAVAVFSRSLPPELTARVLAVMGWLQAGLLAFVLAASDPFARTLPAAAEGRDLNPLLQDVGMIAHPPLLYMGYVGFAVAFAFAIAALLGGRLDAAWARWTRPWTLAAWAFLTAGIGLGSAWAYTELGWGGWWFWDAVENASLMPWLVGAALLHSLAVTEKRDSFKNWTVLLALLAFSLSLLGTFLVRSGVLSSVHAFATDPRRGVLILVFLGVVSGASLLLYVWRAPSVGLGQRFGPASREALLLVNNLLLCAAAASVLLGTLYPLVVDALGLGKLSVGAPYFEAVFTPLMLPLVALTALGPLLAWRQAGWAGALRQLRWVALAAPGLALGVALAWHTSMAVALGLGAGAWLVLGTAAEALKWWRAARRSATRTRPPLAWWGMVAAHAGLGVFVLGVTLVRGFESGADVALRPGQQLALQGAQAGQTLVFTHLERITGPNYTAARARFEYQRDGTTLAVLHPEKRLYTAQGMAMTEAAVQRGLWADRYLALSEATPGGAWIVRVQHKPGMSWLWAGVALMALGGALAAADRRYRRPHPAARHLPQTPGGPAPAGPATRFLAPRFPRRTMSTPARRLHRYLLPLGVMAALLALLGAGLQRDAQALPSVLIGKPAPAFSLARLDAPERRFSPQALRGQPWVLNVWASWCATCRQEHGALLGLAKLNLAPIVGLDYMDSADAGRAWLAEHGNPYAHTVEDPQGRTGIEYGVVGVPETFVIDAGGVVRLKISGPLTAQVLDKQLIPLLKELRRGR